MIMPRGRDDDARRVAFASMVAHELRTPLTAAYGALEMISRGAAEFGVSSERDAALIGLAHRNTRRLLQIVEDCLDLEAASDGRLTLERSAFEPADLLALGMEGARSAREQTGVEVVVKPGACRGLVGDRKRVSRALTHLVQNAVTFAPSGTVVIVTTSDVAEREAVRFTVEDRGAGIEPEQLSALFHRFDCRDAPGRQRVGGLGMGLAFVRIIAELHGGSAGATSEHGRTRVWFEIPCLSSCLP
jgi:signal transduction histidine kinase